MAFLNFYSTAAECGIGADSTLTGAFDTTYCASAVEIKNNNSGPFMSPGPGMHTELWFHCDIYGNNSNMNKINADGTYFIITTNTDYSFFCDLQDGSISLMVSKNNGTNYINRGTLVSCPWRWTLLTLDIHVKLNVDGLHTCDLYVNGGIISSTFIPNSVAAMTTIHGLGWIIDDIDGDIFLSQMIVANEDTRGLKLCSMLPNAAGATAEWIGDFNQAISPDGTFLASDTANQREDWNLTAYPGPASPAGIQVFQKTIAVTGETGPQGIAPYLRIGSTNYDGATVTNPTLTGPIITSWATNPATSLPWDTADLGSLIAGVRSIA